MPESAPVLLSWLLLAPLAQFASADSAREASGAEEPAAESRRSAVGDGNGDETGNGGAVYPGAAAFAEDTLLPEQFFPLLRSYGVEEENLAQLHSLVLAVSELDSAVNANFPAGGAESGRSSQEDSAQLLEEILRRDYISRHLRINRHLDVEWFRGEAFQEIVWWTHLIIRLKTADGGIPFVSKWLSAEERAEYRLQTLLEKA
jgi:hypothetical protein